MAYFSLWFKSNIPKMKKRFEYSEILLIAKALVKEDLNLFISDPSSRVIYDTSEEVHKKTAQKKVLVIVNGLERHQVVESFKLQDFDLIIDFTNQRRKLHEHHDEFRALRNLRGELKWLKAANDNSTNFLHFLGGKALKLRLMRTALTFASYTRLLNFKSLRFSVNSKEKLWFKEGASNYDQIVLSFGTDLIKKRAAALILKNKVAYKFLKIGLSEEGRYAVEREIKRMNNLSHIKFKSFEIPKILKKDGDVLETWPINDISNKKNGLHHRQLFKAIQEISAQNQNHLKLSFTDFYEKVTDRIFYLRKNAPDHLIPYVKKAQHLLSNLNPNDYVKTSLTHGELTPSNILKTDKGIAIVDWEKSLNQGPLLYDAFHYMISEMLVDNQFDLKVFNQNFEALLNQPKIKYIIKKHNLNAQFYFALYLLHKSSEHLLYFTMDGYQKPKHLKWLKFYGELMDNTVLHFQFDNQRKTVLQLTEQYLKSVPYAAVKFQLNGFGELPEKSDLDIAISKKETKRLISYFSDNMLVKTVRTQKFTNLTKLIVWTKDNQFIAIYAIHQLSRKGLKFLDIDEVLKDRIQVNHHFRFSLADDYQYCQVFSALNGVKMESKHHHVFKSYFANNDFGLSIRHLQMFAGTPTKDAFAYTMKKQKQVKKYIKKYNRNKFKLFLRRMVFCQDYLRTALFYRGKVITFSGIDGVEKTTVIDIISKKLVDRYRKDIVLIGRRPGILPFRDDMKRGKKDKHVKLKPKNRSQKQIKLFSMLRFCYYFLDYQIGQIYVYFRYVLRGKVVVYDRYYFDFINDAKSANIKLNHGIVKWLYRLIYKPDLSFYLFNDTETVLSRRVKLSAQEIIKMNANYQDLFSEYEQKKKLNYIKVKTDDPNQTISLIMGELRRIA